MNKVSRRKNDLSKVSHKHEIILVSLHCLHFLTIGLLWLSGSKCLYEVLRVKSLELYLQRKTQEFSVYSIWSNRLNFIFLQLWIESTWEGTGCRDDRRSRNSEIEGEKVPRLQKISQDRDSISEFGVGSVTE